MLQLLQAFGGPGRTALSFAPTYSMYPEYARDTDDRRGSTGRREDDFSLDLDRARGAGRGAAAERRAAALAQQPDRHRAAAGGGHHAVRGGGRRASSWSTRRTASSAGPGTPSALELLPRHRNLVVTRTMSKAFALAGRAGSATSPPTRRSATRSGWCGCPTTCPRSPRRSRWRRCGTRPSCSARSTSCAPSATRRSPGCASRGCEVADSDANFALFGALRGTVMLCGRGCSTGAC